MPFIIKKKANKKLSPNAIRIMTQWLLSDDHFYNPYPTPEEQIILAESSGVSPRQTFNWFVNARKRIWQPLLEEAGIDPKKFLSNRRKFGNKKKFNQCDFVMELKHPLNKENHPPSHKYSSNEIGRCSNKTSSVFNKKSLLRKGAWIPEEEEYVQMLVHAFEKGALPINEGTSLRLFLAQTLNCPPMRISKKFSRQGKIGKIYYSPNSNLTSGEVKELIEKLEVFRHAFETSISIADMIEEKRRSLKHEYTIPKSFQKVSVKQEDDFNPPIEFWSVVSNNVTSNASPFYPALCPESLICVNPLEFEPFIPHNENIFNSLYSLPLDQCISDSLNPYLSDLEWGKPFQDIYY